MRNYKLVLLLKSGVKKDKKEKLLSDVKTWAGDVQKEKVKALGEKKLAYPIKSERKADYLVMEFEGNGIATEFGKRVQMQDEVLRHLLVRND